MMYYLALMKCPAFNIDRVLRAKQLKLAHLKVEFRDEKISLIFNFSSILNAFHAKIIDVTTK